MTGTTLAVHNQIDVQCNSPVTVVFNLGVATPEGRKSFLEAVYWKKSFLSTESDTRILQSIYFAYKVGIISSYSNRTARLQRDVISDAIFCVISDAIFISGRVASW